jgi:branched-chain amino acid transport system permease protein
MTNIRTPLLIGLIAALFICEGMFNVWFFSGSWNSALGILNMALISAVMALGVNLQWGYAGLFNIGIMGFVALGGLAAVLVSMPATEGAWAAGGPRILFGLLLGAATVVAAVVVQYRMAKGQLRNLVTLAVLVGGFFLYRYVFDGGVTPVEEISPAATGYLGGLGLPVLLAWPLGGLLAGGAAWVIGKTALGLRSDYLAIATLGQKRQRHPAPCPVRSL